MRKDRLPKVTVRGCYFGNRTMPSLNDYLDAVSAHEDGNFKKKYTKPMLAAIKRCLRGWKCNHPPVILHYKYYEMKKGHRRDIGNIHGFFQKLFEDALQEAGMIEDDNPDWVSGFTAEFIWLSSGEPYIEVEIEEVRKE